MLPKSTQFFLLVLIKLHKKESNDLQEDKYLRELCSNPNQEN